MEVLVGTSGPGNFLFIINFFGLVLGFVRILSPIKEPVTLWSVINE